MSRWFIVEFYNDEAAMEYKKLDGSVKKLVDVGLRKLETRAEEIGKALEGPLRDCKELKYRKAGVRVIFRISDGVIEIVEIVAIGNRSGGEVFKIAEKRLKAGGE